MCGDDDECNYFESRDDDTTSRLGRTEARMEVAKCRGSLAYWLLKDGAAFAARRHHQLGPPGAAAADDDDGAWGARGGWRV